MFLFYFIIHLLYKKAYHKSTQMFKSIFQEQKWIYKKIKFSFTIYTFLPDAIPNFCILNEVTTSICNLQEIIKFPEVACLYIYRV